MTASVVTRVGNTIRRPRGAGAEVVEALLLHLEDASWPHAPRFLGIDDLGRQILTYVVGQSYRRPPWQLDDAANAEQLGEIAALLRSLHNATATFEPPTGFSSQRHLPVAGETWTHGDPGYSNLVYAGEVIVGLIDWEFAGPADPLCDLVALLAISTRGPRPDVDDHPRRARAVRLAAESIANGYGLSADQITRLPDAAADVLEDTAHHWLTTDTPPGHVERLRWRAAWFRTWEGLESVANPSDEPIQHAYSLAMNRRPRMASSTSPTARRTPRSRASSACQVSTAASTTSIVATSRRSARD